MASASRQNMHAGVASLSLAAQVHRMPPELQSTIFTYTHHPSITYEPEPLVKGGYLSSVQHAYIYSPNTATWCSTCGEQLGEEWVCCTESGDMMCRCCGDRGACLHCEKIAREKRAAEARANAADGAIETEIVA